MRRFVRSGLGVSAAAVILAFGAGGAFAQNKEVVFGFQCDRTGPTATVGTVLCPGYQDYIALVNSKGGVEGYKIKVLEVDNEYKVPPAIEAHERFKKEGAVLEGLYGTPQTAASYWSQAGAAIEFVKEKLGGLKGKKIAYLFYDNPAGKEPLPILEDLAKSEGFELRTFAVPAPGVEMGAQVLDITGRFKPDFVIAHLFGRAPSVFIKELKGKGYPLSKVVSLVWGSAEADIIAAGGMALAEGYNTIQFAGVGKDFPVLKEIAAMYKAQGKEPPKEMDSTVYYNRGVLNAAVHVEALRNAIKAKGGAMPTSDDVKKGMESIKGVTLGGLMPPLEITPTDHEGGGWCQIWTVKGGKLVMVKDWFQGFRPVITKQIAADASKS